MIYELGRMIRGIKKNAHVHNTQNKINMLLRPERYTWIVSTPLHLCASICFSLEAHDVLTSQVAV